MALKVWGTFWVEDNHPTLLFPNRILLLYFLLFQLILYNDARLILLNWHPNHVKNPLLLPITYRIESRKTNSSHCGSPYPLWCDYCPFLLFEHSVFEYRVLSAWDILIVVHLSMSKDYKMLPLPLPPLLMFNFGAVNYLSVPGVINQICIMTLDSLNLCKCLCYNLSRRI
jgi:hypothetical protein